MGVHQNAATTGAQLLLGAEAAIPFGAGTGGSSPWAPTRRCRTISWAAFIEAYFPGLVALDFATWEMPGPSGKSTERCHGFYAMRVATHEVRLLGVTDHVDGQWVTQCCRNLTGFDDPLMAGATTVIMDRDPLSIDAAQECFRSIGCIVRQTSPHSPRCNAHMERFIGTTRSEVERRIIPFSTDALRRTLSQHVAYYNHVRTHQALSGRRFPKPLHDKFLVDEGEVIRRSFLGNMLGYNVREAARLFWHHRPA
ncbi:MAG: integrase core domain-containing protein [Planctomycetota bacterium]|nr:integrase core domain-containing protein [Planctomycetota bacterium]